MKWLIGITTSFISVILGLLVVYSPILPISEAKAPGIDNIPNKAETRQIPYINPSKKGILEAIAFCESSNSHYSGSWIKVGKVNKYDIGKYQINVLYHGKQADLLGFDIYTEIGNEAMANWLFDRYGTKPWQSSSKCWEKLL